MYKLLFILALGFLATACSQSGSVDQENSDSKEASGIKSQEKKPVRKMGKLSVKMFEQIRDVGVNVTVIDVRTPEEIKEGKIPDAMEIDYKGKNFKKQVGELDKNKSYILYCASGNRSTKAADYMLQNGFKNVFNLEGGYKAWKEQTSGAQ